MQVPHRGRHASPRSRAWVGLGAAALFGLAACGGGEQAATQVAAPAIPAVPAVPAAPAAPTITLDATQQQTEASLLPQINAGGRFPGAVVKKENARIFLHLAATSTDPRVQAAALLAMPEVFTHAERFTQNRELMGPEYAQIVLMHIRSTTPRVQGAAIRASKTTILGDTPNPEVLAALTDLASNHPSPEGRYEAMEVLWNASTFRTTAALHAPYVAALDAQQPWLVSIALFRIHHGFASSYADKPALFAKISALTRHADPGVRGRAADVLADLGADASLRPQVVPLLMGLLDDPHPFVKSEAMGALASMNHKPAIHRIVTFLDDMTSNTYDIQGFNDLLGQAGRVHHDGSAWSRVSDAGLSAIRSFAGRTQTPFRYDVDFHDVEGELRRVSREARTWYNAHKAEFPNE